MQIGIIRILCELPNDEKGSANNGNRVAGAPQFVVAGHATCSVPIVPGLGVGADARFTGNTSVRPAGNLNAPGHMLVNLGASYATRIGGYDGTFRAAIDNLLNRRYWECPHADSTTPGDPRTLSLNVRIDF